MNGYITVSTPKKSHFAGLDGLRAIAVLAVIFYHLNISGFFSGGFLGVDIFFTLSGFLITRLLLNEQETQGHINLKKFYIRRFRRLAPAMLGVIGICALIVPIIAPDAANQLAKDIVAAVFYYSNWWQIFSEQSYFEMMNRPPLLQHLWSLAIEEQFYVLWPILLIVVVSRFGRRGLLLLSSLLVFFTASWMAFLAIQQNIPLDIDPNRLYLGTDTHTSGLFAGAMLACLWNPWHFENRFLEKLCSPRLASLLGSCGLAALFALFLWANETQNWLYRGGFVLVAFITSITIIAATTPKSIYERILGTPIMRYLGQRSYGLYLWHWPVFVLLRPQDLILPQAMTEILRLAITLLVAELSFRYIETPLCRDGLSVIKTWNPLKKYSYTLAIVASIIMTTHLVIQQTSNDNITRMQQITNTTTNQPSLPPQISTAPLCPNNNCTSPAIEQDNVATLSTSTADMLAIGDSVMLGAQQYLQKGLPGLLVDAKVGRQGRDAIHIIHQLKANNQLPTSLLIHMGTNGYLPEAAFKQLITELADRKRIILVNIYANRRWMANNNKLLTEFKNEKYKNVILVDWAKKSEEHPEYFVSDGIHLTGKGINAYVETIREASGIRSEFLTTAQLTATKKASPKLAVIATPLANKPIILAKLSTAKSAPAPSNVPMPETHAATNIDDNQTPLANTNNAAADKTADASLPKNDQKDSENTPKTHVDSIPKPSELLITPPQDTENKQNTESKQDEETPKYHIDII